MSKPSYTVIPDSFLDYGLKLSETVALSVIHGFCQDGESGFRGSYSYLARKCMVSRLTAIRIVKKLTNKGFLRIEQNEVNGVKFNTIWTDLGGGVKMIPVVSEGSVKMIPGGGIKMTPKNKDIENKEKIKRTPISPSFDFLSSLRALGVSAETAREWMAVRKTKRATNTRIAFDKVAAEIAKAGRPAEDCVRLCVENSWSGFKAEWMPAPEPVTGRVQSWADYKKENGLI